MDRTDWCLLLVGIPCLVILLAIANRWSRTQEAERVAREVSRWYDCTLPSGEVVRVNWVHTYRDEWELSGTRRYKGSGNLSCKDVGPVRP